jgi:hypothetical protein
MANTNCGFLPVKYFQAVGNDVSSMLRSQAASSGSYSTLNGVNELDFRTRWSVQDIETGDVDGGRGAMRNDADQSAMDRLALNSLNLRGPMQR